MNLTRQGKEIVVIIIIINIIVNNQVKMQVNCMSPHCCRSQTMLETTTSIIINSPMKIQVKRLLRLLLRFLLVVFIFITIMVTMIILVKIITIAHSTTS